MSMPNQQDLTTWQVTGQTEYTQVNPTGQPVAGMKVLFTTGKGHSGSVFVPLAQYNPTTVRGLINTQAATLDAVGSLTGGAGSQ